MTVALVKATVEAQPTLFDNRTFVLPVTLLKRHCLPQVLQDASDGASTPRTTYTAMGFVVSINGIANLDLVGKLGPLKIEAFPGH